MPTGTLPTGLILTAIATDTVTGDTSELSRCFTVGDDNVLSIGDFSATEGDAGTKAFTFTVTRTGSASGTTTVDYATANGTASAPGDYASGSGTLELRLRRDDEAVTVLVNGDMTFEANETFFVNLSSPSGATIADGQGLGTILNDDAAPTLAIDDVNPRRGRFRDDGLHVHGDEDRRDGAGGERRLRHGERDGDGARRLRVGQRHAHLRPG